MYKIKPNDLNALFKILKKNGYQTIGPTVRDSAIVYDEINSTEELPIGYTDAQDGGKYRIKKGNEKTYFGFNVGPQSWKKYLYPPVLNLWSANRDGKRFKINTNETTPPKYAFIGVRACELNAILIQDRVFLEGTYVDSHYKSRRDNSFIVAVNCVQAGGTCFCVSMNSGPKAETDFDIALTEVLQSNQHYFIAESGSEKGDKILSQVPHETATEKQKDAANSAIKKAEVQMGRSMDTTNIKELLQGNLEHSHWDEIAKRCLTCANCTMVCPTCFCTTVEDVTDLSGNSATRVRKWDSCFTQDFSYIHGGSIRTSGSARYRQWMTHKLASWIDQFGVSGCVGCGRCITWCPVGIDITEEVRFFQKNTKISKN